MVVEPEQDDAAQLLAAGEARERVLGQLFEGYRPRLRRMVDLRLDARLQQRVDASDVVQEAYLEVSSRLEDYLREPGMPFYLWVRFITGQKLLMLHRHHLGAQKRAAGRQVSLDRAATPDASSVAVARQLLARGTTPSVAVVRAELHSLVVDALESMRPLDREVLVLRHFEQLSNAETAEVLGIGEAGASNRYVRALERLREVLRTQGATGLGGEAQAP